jgi:small subunit ribosomal protein S17
MADEEQNQEEKTEDTPQADAAEEKAETPAEEAPAVEEAPADKAAEEAPADDGADDADSGAPTPKQLRKRERSLFKGPAREQTSPEQRAQERTATRKAKADARRRWRATRRGKAAATESGPATTQKQPRDSAARKTRQGIVVSSKGQKTITVRIDHVRRHRTYGKVLRETTTLHAHDETNEAGEGDTVRVVECRPLSRTKRWRLVEILEKAK